MDDGVPNDEDVDATNKVAPEIEAGQVETATGPGPLNLYYKPAVLNYGGPAARENKTIQIIFFSLLLTASVFALIAFILLICFYKEQAKIARFEWEWAGTPIVHEVIMIIFGVVIEGFAILVYRIIPCCSINALKYIHFGLHALVGFFMLCGLNYVFYTKWVLGDFHFTSQHSWAGIISLSCFILQLSAGTFVLLPPIIPIQIRTALIPIHKAAGWVIYLASCSTALVGITNIERYHELGFSDLHESKKHRPPGVRLTEDELLVRFAFLFLLFHVLIMLYLGIAPQFQRPPRPQT